MAANPHTEPEFATISAPGHNDARNKKKSHTGFLVLVLLLAAGLAAGVVYELSQRKAQEQQLAANTVENAGGGGAPVVQVARVRLAPSEATVEIPGQTVALVETPIYARTDGYIKQLGVEIGQRVKKGQLLLELDTPDLDQQIAQAQAQFVQSQAALAQLQATLKSVQATLKLAQVTAQRTKSLADAGVASQQDKDTANAAADAGEANVHAAEENIRAQQSLIVANDANVKRLVETKKYARMEAPYDGVITYRNPTSSDIGTLISSGAATSAREILRISQIETLRVFVDVPQTYAPVIRVGQPAELLVDEFPGRVFPATVQSATGSVDPNSRTMLTILVVDNKAGTLLPGMFAKTRFRLPHTINVLRLPAEALLFRTEGPMAAVAGPDRKVHFHKLTLGRDYGAQVEVTSGLDPGDLVVMNPTDAIHEGAEVETKER